MKIVVAVFDKAAQTYTIPMFFPAVGLAVRQFTDEVNKVNGDNSLYNHPEDFSFWQLGGYDEVTGEFIPDKKKLLDAVAVAVRG